MSETKKADVEGIAVPDGAETTHADHSISHDDFLDFLYQIFFERDAERAALDHWKPYLERGLPPMELFRALYGSPEFANRANQNHFLKAPLKAIDKHENRNRIITDSFFADILQTLSSDQDQLLHIPSVRAQVAQWRYRDLMQTRGVELANASALSIPDTIPYSEFTLRSYVADDRPMHMIRPLVSIGRIAENVATLKVLSIGGRTEMELFALLAGGFTLANITMIDLFSYSPFVHVGDMHKMAFADSSFDVIVFGDVLAYSTAPSIAVKEIVRVVKNKAVASTAHGCTTGYKPLWEKSVNDPAGENFKGISIQSTEDILRLFAGFIGQVYVRLEPETVKTPQLNRALTVFEIIKAN